MRALFIALLLLTGSSGCEKATRPPLIDTATQSTAEADVDFIRELADRGATLDVIAVHYVITGKGLVVLTILKDTDTNNRIRVIEEIGALSRQYEVQREQEGFYVAGDRIRLSRREDGAVLLALLPDQSQQPKQ